MSVSIRANAGFTLIELLVALAIAGILLVLALPNYVVWTADANARNAASSLADGLRYAQGEAVKRNQNVEFVLAGGGWTIQLVNGTVLRTNSVGEGTKNATFTPSPATSTTVTFNALGQVETTNAAPPPAPLQRVDLTAPNATRNLRVMVGHPTQPNSARIKICDPLYAWPDPKGCPP
jgi:prepilin-type N-terminal cleavage/methylation domain-containing protein